MPPLLTDFMQCFVCAYRRLRSGTHEIPTQMAHFSIFPTLLRFESLIVHERFSTARSQCQDTRRFFKEFDLCLSPSKNKSFWKWTI